MELPQEVIGTPSAPGPVFETFAPTFAEPALVVETIASAQDASMVSDEVGDDDSFAQVASKRARKGAGFVGFGTPDPFDHNDKKGRGKNIKDRIKGAQKVAEFGAPPSMAQAAWSHKAMVDPACDPICICKMVELQFLILKSHKDVAVHLRMSELSEWLNSRMD